jgi:putative flippase GtrA
VLRAHQFGQLLRFGVVGGCATVLYVILAFSFARTFAQWPSAASAFGAYLVAGLFSYLAHKLFTFASDGSHGREAPRFMLVSAAGFGIAALLPFVLHDVMGLSLAIPVLLTAVLVPVMNFVALRWFVFDRAAGRNGLS